VTAAAGSGEVDVRVDPAVCISATRCMTAAPAAFRLGPDGLSEPADLTGLSVEQIVEIAKHCPVRAIAVRQDGQELELPD
jgi:ferredoxin